MFLVGILSWWYKNGWKSRVQIVKSRFESSADFFSIRLLASTIFAPFRQISAGSVSGPLAEQLRAFFDRLISRVVGAVVRTFMIIFGGLAMILQLIFGGFVIIIWPILPFLPVIGLILMVTGWVPQWKV